VRIDRSQRPAHAAPTKKAPANQLWRFAQKSGFGERRCGAKSPRMKIFSLPKTATQSPRNTLSSGIDESR
jgi:hypothetical protein